jgi:ribosomal protein S18 acetylase RimI-like enzyme
MPNIHVRPLFAADLPDLIAIDHSYITDYVWQMDLREEEKKVSVRFNEIRLPRSVQLEYPRDPQHLADTWNQFAGFLVAEHEKEVLGYIAVHRTPGAHVAHITDLAVKRRIRRRGVGASLLLAALEWASHQQVAQITAEVQSKNVPAIRLMKKIGFSICGYNDRYYPNQDIALFFGKIVR